MPVFEIKLQLKSIDNRLYALRSLEAGLFISGVIVSVSPLAFIFFLTLYHPTTYLDVTFVWLNNRQSLIWWIHPF